MPAPRTLAVALSGAALLLSVTGCEKPSAGVSLSSGSEFKHVEAGQYCRDGKALTTGNECPGSGPHLTILKVRQGAEVGVDVDKALRESGWYVFDDDARVKSAVKETSHTTFVADFSDRPAAGIINLEVRQVDHLPSTDTDLPKITGQWRFQLVQTD